MIPSPALVEEETIGSGWVRDATDLILGGPVYE